LPLVSVRELRACSSLHLELWLMQLDMYTLLSQQSCGVKIACANPEASVVACFYLVSCNSEQQTQCLDGFGATNGLCCKVGSDPDGRINSTERYEYEFVAEACSADKHMAVDNVL